MSSRRRSEVWNSEWESYAFRSGDQFGDPLAIDVLGVGATVVTISNTQANSTAKTKKGM